MANDGLRLSSLASASELGSRECWLHLDPGGSLQDGSQVRSKFRAGVINRFHSLQGLAKAQAYRGGCGFGQPHAVQASGYQSRLDLIGAVQVEAEKHPERH